MKKSLKKLMAIVMASCMVASCFPAEFTYAEENETTVSEEESIKLDSEDTEQNQQIQDEQATEDTSDTVEADEETESKETVFEDSVIEKNKNQINYVFVESPYLETPGTQRIAVSYGDGTENIQSLVLDVENAEGEVEQWNSTVNVDNLYLFEKNYEDESASGTYKVTDLREQMKKENTQRNFQIMEWKHCLV